ncbi:MAG: hypothetical protein ACP5UV_02055 [Thermoplasmata archaeon]
MESKNVKIEYKREKHFRIIRDVVLFAVVASFAVLLFTMGLSYFMLISFAFDILVIMAILALLSIMINENLFRMIAYHIKRK